MKRFQDLFASGSFRAFRVAASTTSQAIRRRTRRTSTIDAKAALSLRVPVMEHCLRKLILCLQQRAEFASDLRQALTTSVPNNFIICFRQIIAVRRRWLILAS